MVFGSNWDVVEFTVAPRATATASHGSFDFSFAGCETIFQIVEELSNVFERDLLPTLNSLSRTRSAGSSSEKLPPQRLTGTL
ncbi:MAG: hypothetical protein DMG69_21570 [Acidobacteria bacterium]|nr:MAG: hypothetical protein DMG69_21570 [Acidobacteriota bacterium]